MLQAVQYNLDGDYRLIRSINANKTYKYNEIKMIDQNLLIMNDLESGSYIQKYRLDYEPVVDSIKVEC